MRSACHATSAIAPQPLEFNPNSALQQTEHVWTVNGDWDPVPNNVVHLAHRADAQQFEYTSTSLGEGYSGGPVFDDAGHLVGIHTSESGRADYRLGVAVKIGSVIDALEALQLSRASLNDLVPARGGSLAAANLASRGTSTQSAVPKPPMWRNLNNNQLYSIRTEADRIYISQANGNVIADLVLKADRSGTKRFSGSSTLSACPGSGYLEISSVTDTRIEGRIEVKPTIPNAKCGGLFGVGRSLVPITFLSEPGR